MLKLLHLANWQSANIGNGALISGTERLLREDLHGAVEFRPEPWDDYTFGLKRFDEGFVELVNRHDGLVVGGAVTMNGRRYLKETGMRFELPLPLWPKIKVPIIFYGISYRVWPGQRFHNRHRLLETVRGALRNDNVLFGVRNDGTKEWLQGLLGFASDKIREVPDPALFVETEDVPHPELSPGKLNVILSLNNEDEAHRFGGAERRLLWALGSPFLSEEMMRRFWEVLPFRNRRKRIFLKALAEVLEELSQKEPLNLILCPHYLDDYRMLHEFIGFCKPRFAHQLIVSTGLLRVPETKRFYDLYKKADLALAMRVHAISPSVGLSTPVIPLSSQDRVSAFLSKAGLSEWEVSVFDRAFRERLSLRIAYLLSQREAARRELEERKEAMRREARSFNALAALRLASGK